MNLGDSLLASLGLNIGSRKRRRSSSAGGAGPSAKRPRPPSDDEDQETGGGASVTEDGKEYTPLDSAARRSMSAHIDRLLESEKDEHTCFFCVMVERYDSEKKRTGGQREFLSEGAYAYKLAIDFYNNNPLMPAVARARGLDTIYRTHVYDPACAALGGAKPPGWPEPSVRSMLEHIMRYNFDLVALKLEQLNNARELAFSLRDYVIADGKPSASMSRTFVLANAQVAAFTDALAKLMEGRPQGPFALDVQKVMTFADTRPIDVIRQQARGAIGGATSTNTTQETQRVNALRPNFGRMQESSAAEAPTESEGGLYDEPEES